jgi:O-antigen/teichoic acid export membrane protein
MAMFRRLPTLSPVAWTAVERVTQQILWLVLFAILAPILGPRPYGLFAIGSVFVGFCEIALMEGAIEALVSWITCTPRRPISPTARSRSD